MGNTATKFIVTAQGQREAVLLDLASYRRLLRRLEDLEDALTLDRAEDSSRKLLSYQRVRKRLKRAGKL
ncbi:MAG: hypothetical protein LAN62_04205 [Acidobacteriia bacterium]|nr:hypothetical protein [Terriglobia bacterium]